MFLFCTNDDTLSWYSWKSTVGSWLIGWNVEIWVRIGAREGPEPNFFSEVFIKGFLGEIWTHFGFLHKSRNAQEAKIFHSTLSCPQKTSKSLCQTKNHPKKRFAFRGSKQFNIFELNKFFVRDYCQNTIKLNLNHN